MAQFALLAMSHSPLLGINDPGDEVTTSLNAAFDEVRTFVNDFDPDLIVTIAPDHYNGFFYDLMPPYCVGYEALSVGDYESTEGPLSVPTEISEEMAQFIINEGIDIAISRRMEIDHGAVQPIELLYDSLTAKPTIPVYVNGVARPFVPMERVRKMGQALGKYLATRDEKILLIASGGLSHDPPVPQWATATEEQRALLLAGRHPTAEARNARQTRVIETAKSFAKGEADILDLNPEWDRTFMDDCAAADPTRFDRYTADEMDEQAGHSSHEVRSWVAAFSALHAAVGEYTIDYEYYKPIREFIAGFGIMTARPK
ncbi:3-carboxyethylcatechol 2,3-dioxygenase [Corynebacterium felinum]|uniref:2,3-dihydroxyphenylpropionate/2,3-dihydroxicinnamic acid 1,2-dioxygenase n=1 Tax=Corynebacterium felinum TaxID=131318 RepID=A0ABU2B6F3_9CORY|nr:3-carboxyethylcatechol 2,3-dioxygenase [Corynebacterium felinum]MDF5820751.1 3-carboxyethylcatechol 2,3-dioxygenase [Corynebacterium felinum]MDR7354197.1 2,3-dihydroxyphenylpropionate 1,2-dioxygenase [Corynebacterium felinum]WJY96366.1 2,3-dihydroxyphenylpropionate/2,3-dihydroxicinnamic acid 1,2-dioxygenase [Corynebacterium felinum]